MTYHYICKLETCKKPFTTVYKQTRYCCKEHGRIGNRINNNARRAKQRKANPEFYNAKKRLEYVPSARLAGKLVNCECPICHRHFKDRNCYPIRFCEVCRPIAEGDYSGGYGQKYDYRTDKIQDFL
jgi:hypothetical protein